VFSPIGFDDKSALFLSLRAQGHLRGFPVPEHRRSHGAIIRTFPQTREDTGPPVDRLALYDEEEAVAVCTTLWVTTKGSPNLQPVVHEFPTPSHT
jgi:hypothetical protein